MVDTSFPFYILRCSAFCVYTNILTSCHQKLLNGQSYRNAVINTLLATLYEKSNETEEHSNRMEKHCHSIGRALRLSSKEMAELSLLALLHDIGKVGVHLDILQKPGPLTTKEWEEMKRHPEIGSRIAQATPELSVVADLILAHHERWDGTGYPRGLKGEEIPLACRILAVTDAYDAMTNDRAYRAAKSHEETISELLGNAGTQFDPQITALFINILHVEHETDPYMGLEDIQEVRRDR
ncbi:HD-GYP domain-containing protein [Lacrimispora defluvii]|uniref:HD-GYP domain-containing protein n=1 Tax=Lacrimispora defluvii TaxID=2719233 RepID=A0ABX1VQ72_9FIRM|nr:HD-GYP domain-containing protein [Lacrimispora defluvii]NNJ30583.1 HD-GYP domain-containing protein [Lacrimispora defluvii]